MLGTNDHPGDFRSSGCTACHVVYANDRSRSNSGPYSQFGNRGLTQTVDKTIPRDEPGHPLKHVFTRSIPSSQCMTCHMHPGTSMVSTYMGYTWWDNEADGQHMYPKEQKERSSSERASHRAGQPRGRRPARAVVGSQLPGRRRDPEPQARQDAVRRLPRPRMGVPRRLQERPRGAPPRPGGQGRRRQRYREVQEGRPPQGHPPREGDALRGLPLQAGQPRQHQALHASRGRRWRSTASTATARSPAPPT